MAIASARRGDFCMFSPRRGLTGSGTIPGGGTRRRRLRRVTDRSGARLSAKAERFTESVIREMNRLAVARGAVSLAQGFPDFAAPDEIKQAAVEAILGDVNQYAITWGSKALRDAIAAKTARTYPGWAPDPETEITVTCGATEGMVAAMLGILDPGDEVIVFEPFYENYGPDAILTGAMPRYVALQPPDWSFDPDALRAAVSTRTRAIVLNSPHNPTGKVFTPAELELIAALCREFDVFAVTDEVYEHLVFPDAAAPHVPLASLPGMRERTLRISSAGKTFSCTGWKIGWATGPTRLISAVLRVKQFLTFVNGAPLQPAVAVALNLPDSYFAGFTAGLRERRDRLVAGLTEAGLAVLPSEGTYFVTADIRPAGGTDGVEFCRELPARSGVVAVPTQVFYDHQEAGRHLIRFAFCKRLEVIDEAVRRLKG
jgi:N-succinyldiaminopimelate aminotransferase